MKVESGLRVGALFIAGTRHHLYLRRSMFRLFSSLLIALALFASPLVMANGAGMAMSHAAATFEVQAGSHCADGEAPADHKKSQGKASCASACAAFPAVSPSPLEVAPAVRPPVAAGVPQALSGIHPERELRPPRIPPEI
jgi:hypothetical protein